MLDTDLIKELKNSPIFNMSLSGKELFHSNFLAWIGIAYPKVFKSFWSNTPDQELGPVDREKGNIDLSFKIGRKPYYIENKVKSQPYEAQLEKYTNKCLKEWKKLTQPNNEEYAFYFKKTVIELFENLEKKTSIQGFKEICLERSSRIFFSFQKTYKSNNGIKTFNHKIRESADYATYSYEQLKVQYDNLKKTADKSKGAELEVWENLDPDFQKSVKRLYWLDLVNKNPVIQKEIEDESKLSDTALRKKCEHEWQLKRKPKFILLSLSKPSWDIGKPINAEYVINDIEHKEKIKWSLIRYQNIKDKLDEPVEVFDIYHKQLIVEYIKLLDVLIDVDEKTNFDINEYYNQYYDPTKNTFLKSLNELRMGDLYQKLKYEKLASFIGYKLSKFKPALDSNGDFWATDFVEGIKVQSGMSRATGLMSLVKKIDDSYIVGIQLQGSQYRVFVDIKNKKYSHEEELKKIFKAIKGCNRSFKMKGFDLNEESFFNEKSLEYNSFNNPNKGSCFYYFYEKIEETCMLSDLIKKITEDFRAIVQKQPF